MQPIFNELIGMWRSKGFDFPLYEGTFWLDNLIVKAFSKNEKHDLIPLYKIKIEDDLSIKFTKHKKCPNYEDFNFETWDETIERTKLVFN